MCAVKEDQHNNEINLLDLAKVILKHKKVVIWVVLVIVVAAAIISLLMTKIYESKAVISPVQQSTGQGGTMSAVAAQFGIVAPQSSNLSEIIGLLKSDILMQKVLEKENLDSALFTKADLQGKTENEKVWKGILALKKEIVKVTENKKDNMITVSAQYKDPVVAQRIASAVLNELTEYMTGEAKRVAEANRKHLETQIVNTGDPLVRQKMYSLIAQQIETVMMAEAKENFAFKVIDPPRVPVERVKPKRTRMVVIAFIVSLFLGVFLAFVREHYERNGEVWREIGVLTGLKPFSRKG